MPSNSDGADTRSCCISLNRVQERIECVYVVSVPNYIDISREIEGAISATKRYRELIALLICSGRWSSKKPNTSNKGITVVGSAENSRLKAKLSSGESCPSSGRCLALIGRIRESCYLDDLRRRQASKLECTHLTPLLMDPHRDAIRLSALLLL